jgi:hypothetical protein
MDNTNSEFEFDGITYLSGYYGGHIYGGDPSGFWEGIEEKERHEIKRKMIKHLVEVGYLIRKSDLEKRNSIYKKDELFYEMEGET